MNLKFNGEKFVSRIFWGLIAIAVFLFLADASLNYANWIETKTLQRFFNSTREDSLSNWISSLTQLCLGFICLFHILLIPENSQTKWSKRGWLASAILFFMVALDDGTKFHERLGPFIRDLTPWYPSYAWQMTFGLVYGLLGLSVIYFLHREFKRDHLTKYLWIFVSLIFFSQFLDFLEGIDKAAYAPLKELTGIGLKPIRHFSKTFEEMTELISFSFIGLGLLKLMVIKLSEIKQIEVAKQ